eukprot:820405-Rhodomonas_salina.1
MEGRTIMIGRSACEGSQRSVPKRAIGQYRLYRRLQYRAARSKLVADREGFVRCSAIALVRQ